jgi:hypothetical protein
MLALAMLTVFPLTIQGSPLYHNFVVLPELSVTSGQAFAMSVSLHNEAPLSKVTVPLLIRDVDFLNIDSISFVGSRFDGLGISVGTFDNGTHTMMLKFDGTPSDFLPPGDGNIANIYFKMAPGAPLGDVVIDTTVLSPDIYLLEDTTGANVEDYFVFGLIHVVRENPDVTRCLALHEGWNLISWDVDTPDDDIETIIKDIKGCIDVVLGFEQGAATYDPSLPQFSTLNILDHLHGYWFRMNCDTTLCVTGPKVAPDTPIDLEQNWNLVSYLPEEADTTPHALLSVLDGLIVALGFDNGGLTYDPTQPQFATLNKMKPGFGYWLKTDGPATLIYSGPIPKTSIYVASHGTMKAYPPAAGVTPTTEWVNLFGDGITLDGTLIPTGTVLAAYDENGHLCGQATVGTGGKISFTPVYRDDESTTTVEGPGLGGSINLTVNGIPVQQSYTFGGLGDRIRLTTLTSLSRPSENLPRQFGLAQNYPNPFNPSTSIDFSLPVASRATVDVYNVVGEKVTTLLDRFLPAGRYSVSWDGANANGKPASSGMYFYRLKAGEFTDTKKMMLVK